ncbi:MAG: hypothetical protein H6Q72_1279 [Firmicutes bacterium]|nr:hypothetical protein [Bacillota bacterium]
MDKLIENIYNIYIVLLGAGIFFLIVRYFYTKAYSHKSIFQKQIDYVEIRSWRKRIHRRI